MNRCRLDAAGKQCQKRSVIRSFLLGRAESVKAESWLRSAICGLLVFAQVFAFGHIVLVGHRICAEHGEAIHDGNVRGAHAPGEAAESAGVLLAAPVASVGHEHEHCLCMAHGRERFLMAFPVGDRLPPRAFIRFRPAPPTSALASTIALLSLAPKGSPPA